jgi:magnesium transporter
LNLHERLLKQFAARHPVEAAAILAEQTAEGAADVLARLPEDDAARVLERTPTAEAARALAHSEREAATALVARLPPERAAAVLRAFDSETREAFLAKLPTAGRLRALIAYPPHTAGSLMDPSVPAFLGDLDLAHVRQRLSQAPGQLALEVYVVDAAGHPLGVADLREVLDPERAGPLVAVSGPVEPLPELADLASLGAHPGWLRHGTLPVVDDHGRYLGAVRAERARQAAHQAVGRRSRGGADAVVALGELFWLGLTGLFSTLTQSRTEDVA